MPQAAWEGNGISSATLPTSLQFTGGPIRTRSREEASLADCHSPGNDSTGKIMAECTAADMSHFTGSQQQLALASLANIGCYAVGNSVLVPPPFGSYGSSGRNLWRDAGFKEVDLSIAKRLSSTTGSARSLRLNSSIFSTIPFSAIRMVSQEARIRRREILPG